MTKTELLQLMAKLFNEYNNKYFYGKIRTPKFGLFHKQRTFGTYYREEHKISLTDYYIDKWAIHDVEEIMVHEMVHAYLHETHNEDVGAHYSHGPRFYDCANRVNRQSNGYFHISRTTKLSCGTAPKKRNTDNVILIIGKTLDGRNIIGRISADKSYRFTDGWLSQYFTDMELCEAIDGSKFGYLKQSYKQFNYRYTTEESLVNDIYPNVRKLRKI